MGSSARRNRCDRFVKEFSSDAVSIYGLHGFPFVEECNLGTGDDEQVHFYMMLRHGMKRVEVMLEIVFFNPEEPDAMTIGNVCDLFRIHEDDAISRLQKAKLVSLSR